MLCTGSARTMSTHNMGQETCGLSILASCMLLWKERGNGGHQEGNRQLSAVHDSTLIPAHPTHCPTPDTPTPAASHHLGVHQLHIHLKPPPPHTSLASISSAHTDRPRRLTSRWPPSARHPPPHPASHLVGLHQLDCLSRCEHVEQRLKHELVVAIVPAGNQGRPRVESGRWRRDAWVGSG
eukprot:188078-Chlamydomonas_euryale.AAC.1